MMVADNAMAEAGNAMAKQAFIKASSPVAMPFSLIAFTLSLNAFPLALNVVTLFPVAVAFTAFAFIKALLCKEFGVIPAFFGLNNRRMINTAALVSVNTATVTVINS